VFQRRYTVSSYDEFRASASISMPTYSSTPLPPSMKLICVSAAMVLARPLSKIGVGAAGAAGAAGVVLMVVMVTGCCEVAADMWFLPTGCPIARDIVLNPPPQGSATSKKRCLPTVAKNEDASGLVCRMEPHRGGPNRFRTVLGAFFRSRGRGPTRLL
jgi:hypothetical protein